MWNVIVESGIIALLFGFVTSVSGIIITNNINKKHEQKEKRYVLVKEIYQSLVSTYEEQLDKNSIEEMGEKNISDLFTDSLIQAYKNAKIVFDNLNISYMKIKYLLNEKDIKDFELEFKIVSGIEQTLYFSSLNNKIKGKKEYENITINSDVVLIEQEKIPEYMKEYIEKVKILQNHFIKMIEKELRKLLN